MPNVDISKAYNINWEAMWEPIPMRTAEEKRITDERTMHYLLNNFSYVS